MIFNKKLINTLGQIEELLLKEVVLNKKTFHAQTTEKFLNISLQPENTCPFINDAKKHNGRIVKKINEMINSFKYEAGRRYVEEAECCDSERVILENKDTLYLMVDQMENQVDYISNIDEILEDLRNCCDNFREYGNDLKSLYWSYLEFKMNQKELEHDYKLQIKHKPSSWFTKKQFEQSYEKIVFKNFEFKSTTCMQRCNTSKLNYWLESAFEEYKNLQVPVPEEIEQAIDNLQKIESWCSDLESYLEGLIKKPVTIQVGENQVNEYVKDLNDYQIFKFENYLKKIAKDPILLFNWRSIVAKANLKNELACNDIKLLDELEKDINCFIVRYNQLPEEYMIESEKVKKEFIAFHLTVPLVFQIHSTMCEPVKLRIQQLRDYFTHQVASVGPFSYELL